MKIPLTISVEYMPSWGVVEGLRELVQNWLDAADKTGERVDPTFARQTVTLYNPGATLDKSVLLLGTTSKANDETQRGQFGEGLKIGTLALVRAGCKVTVYTGTERWTAAIDALAQFAGSRVLVWTTTADKTPGVKVVIGGVSAEAWTEARGLFRAITALKGDYANAYDGELILREPGAMYVKGIRVGTDDKLAFGYDFARVQVDRDRRMVRTFDVGWHAGRLIVGATDAGTLSPAAVLDFAMNGTPDTAMLECGTTSTFTAAMVTAFKAKFGENVVPCKDAAEVQTCVNLDRHGVAIPGSLYRLLSPTMGTVDTLRTAASDNVVRRYNVDELSEEDQASLDWALTHAAIGLDLCRHHVAVSVVDYMVADTMGMFRSALRPVEVARWVLADREQALATIIHEVAHTIAGDGERAHTALIENAWVRLAKLWLSGAVPEPKIKATVLDGDFCF